MEEQEEIHKGNQFKKIFETGSWYFIGSLLTKATSFFLLPVYTSYLSPADYGVLNSLNSVSNLLPIFISLYLDSAFGRYYFTAKKVSHKDLAILYSTLFWFILIWGIGVVIISFILSPYLIQPLLKVTFLPYIPLIMIPALLGQLSLLGTVFLKSSLKAKEVTIINLVAAFFTIALTVVLLVRFNLGIQSNLYGTALGSVITLSYFLYISRRYRLLIFHFKWDLLWMSMIFSLPLIPNIAGGWIGGLSDRLIMAYYGKIEQVGLYSISAQIALILYMVNDAVTQVQGPIAFSALTSDHESGKKQISQFLSFFIWFILLFYIILSMFSKEILLVMTDERYHSSYKLVSILAFTYVLSGIYRIFTSMLSYHNKMWVISSAAIISALISMILNFIFIPFFGQWAAALANLISVFTYTLWLYLWSQATDKIEINYSLIITCFLSVLFIMAFYIFTDTILSLTIIGNVIIKLFLILLYFIPVILFPSFHEIKENIVKVYQRIIN